MYINDSLRQVRAYMGGVVASTDGSLFPAVHPKCFDMVNLDQNEKHDAAGAKALVTALSTAIGTEQDGKNIVFCVVGVLNLSAATNEDTLSRYICMNPFQRGLNTVTSWTELKTLANALATLLYPIAGGEPPSLTQKVMKFFGNGMGQPHTGTKKNFTAFVSSKRDLLKSIKDLLEVKISSDHEFLVVYGKIQDLIRTVDEFNSTNPIGILGYVDQISKMGLTHGVCRIEPNDKTDPFQDSGSSMDLVGALKSAKDTLINEKAQNGLKQTVLGRLINKLNPFATSR